jgi:hypothetical protein
LTAAALLPAWLVQACYAWQTQPVAPRQAIEQQPLVRARLIRADSSSIDLTGPRIRGDSIAGLIGMEERAIALRDVSAVQIRRFSAGRTIGVWALATLAFTVVIALSPRRESTCPGGIICF